MIIQYVKLQTRLSHDELEAIAQERAPQFRAIEGLIQKYYVDRGGPGQVGGIYVWDSRESLAAFRQSELAQTIAQAYQVVAPPEIEIVDVLFPLREG